MSVGHARAVDRRASSHPTKASAVIYRDDGSGWLPRDPILAKPWFHRKLSSADYFIDQSMRTRYLDRRQL